MIKGGENKNKRGKKFRVQQNIKRGGGRQKNEGRHFSLQNGVKKLRKFNLQISFLLIYTPCCFYLVLRRRDEACNLISFSYLLFNRLKAVKLSLNNKHVINTPPFALGIANNTKNSKNRYPSGGNNTECRKSSNNVPSPPQNT